MDLNKLDQKNFEHIINILILYNSMTPKTTEVFLNEKSIKDAFDFIQRSGHKLSDYLNL